MVTANCDGNDVLQRQRLRDNYYKSWKAFRDDVELLVTNSVAYNGPGNTITLMARKIVRAISIITITIVSSMCLSGFEIG